MFKNLTSNSPLTVIPIYFSLKQLEIFKVKKKKKKMPYPLQLGLGQVENPIKSNPL